MRSALSTSRAGRASRRCSKGGRPLVYYVFDLLELEGEPLSDRPLTERRDRLEEILDRRNRVVQLSEAFDDGAGARAGGRRAGSRGGHGETCRLAVRARETQPRLAEGQAGAAAAGIRRRRLHEGPGPAQRLARRARAGRPPRPDDLEWVGNVGTGFSEPDARRPDGELRPLERDTSPLAAPPKMPRVRKGRRRLGRARSSSPRSRSPSGRTTSTCGRRGSYGIRETTKTPRSAPRGADRDGDPPGKKVLRLSNLDKVFWPDEGITKGDLLAYYRDVAPVLVPHLRDRPFTLKRYPNGVTTTSSSRRTRRRACRTGSRRARSCATRDRLAASA